MKKPKIDPDLREQRDNYIKIIKNYAVKDGEKTYTIDNPLILSIEDAQDMRDYVKERYLAPRREPFVLSYGQVLIFYTIAYRPHSYAQLLSSTQYGKTEVVSIAILERASNFPEEWLIVTPSAPKGEIMMRKMLSHIFDNEQTKSKFLAHKDNSMTKEEQILHSKGKTNVTFSMGEGGGVGRVRVVSLDAKNIQQGMEAAMGEGSENVVADESALLDDLQEVGVARMIGGHKKPCYIKIGNPFHRNHFMESWRNDPDYKKVFIPYQQGLVEGRLQPEFIDKMRRKKRFDVLYECRFPGEEDADDRNFKPLVRESVLERCIVEDVPDITDYCVYSIDVAGGGKNYSVITRRTRFGIKKLRKEDEKDTTKLRNWMVDIIRKDNPKDFRIIPDSVGIGRGLSDLLKNEYKDKVIPFIGGGNDAMTKEQCTEYENNRAYCYWLLMEYLEAGGKLEKDLKDPDDEDWKEICVNRYKENKSSRIILMSKDDLKKHYGIESPDVADSASMLFRTELPEGEEEDYTGTEDDFSKGVMDEVWKLW